MRRYLLVDDNRELADNLAEIISDLGDEVDVADSGTEALKLVSSSARRYDVLVTDMRMPLMSGAELVHRIRALDPGLPAIIVTAYAGDEDLRIAREEGLLAVLHKPLPIPRLLNLLAVARRDGFVLLVEDDEALADNLAEALRTRGLTTITAHSMTDTERLGAVKPFAALVDLRIPGGQPGQPLQRVLEKFDNLPVIVITAYLERALPSAKAVFTKPFDTGLLLREVEGHYRPPAPRA